MNSKILFVSFLLVALIGVVSSQYFIGGNTLGDEAQGKDKSWQTKSENDDALRKDSVVQNSKRSKNRKTQLQI
jgi:hypothetical protein